MIGNQKLRLGGGGLSDAVSYTCISIPCFIPSLKAK